MAGPATVILQAAATAVAADLTKMTLHTADPGTTGANLSSAAAQAIVATASAGVVTVPSTSFTGGAPGGPCTYAGLWNGTTFCWGIALTGDQTFNSAGAYTVTSVTITVT